MAVRPILLLGHPILRTTCRAVGRSRIPERRTTIDDLRDTLHDFRRRSGFGRGISAPQIGISERIIYVDFEFTGPLIDPRIVSRSRRKFQLWDDCFSFPDLLVRVQRNESIVVEYLDADGKRRQVKARGALSELLQHEIDHLDGILAIDRAIDASHIIYRTELERFVPTRTNAGL